jgi:hypothetical protein
MKGTLYSIPYCSNAVRHRNLNSSDICQFVLQGSQGMELGELMDKSLGVVVDQLFHIPKPKIQMSIKNSKYQSTYAKPARKDRILTG